MNRTYTNEEFQEAILMIVNSDKENGFTSKELHEMFGNAVPKTQILSMKPDKIMEALYKNKWKFIKVGDIVKHKDGWVGVCTRIYDNISIYIVDENGYATRTFKQNCEVVGKMDVSKFLLDIKRNAKGVTNSHCIKR